MFVEILIFCALITSQFGIGIFAWALKRSLAKKYEFVLTQLNEPADILQTYSRVYRKVNLRVNANIDQPAYAEDNFLLVHRDSMYLPYLFNNYFVIYQLELTKTEHKFTRELFRVQHILFFIEILLFFIGLFLGSEMGRIIVILSIGLQIIIYTITIMGFYSLEYILDSTHEVAKDLLNFDDIDSARAVSLKDDLRFTVFEYPIEFFWRIFSIFR